MAKSTLPEDISVVSERWFALTFCVINPYATGG